MSPLMVCIAVTITRGGRGGKEPKGRGKSQGEGQGAKEEGQGAKGEGQGAKGKGVSGEKMHLAKLHPLVKLEGVLSLLWRKE